MMNGIGDQMVNGVGGGGIGGSKTAQQNATMPANSHQQHYVGNVGDMNGSAYHQYMRTSGAVVNGGGGGGSGGSGVAHPNGIAVDYHTHAHATGVGGPVNGAANNNSLLLSNNNNCNNNSLRGSTLRDASAGSGGHMLGGAGVGIGVNVGVGVGGGGVSTSAGSGVVGGAATLPYKNNGLNNNYRYNGRANIGTGTTYQSNNSIAKSRCLHYLHLVLTKLS